MVAVHGGRFVKGGSGVAMVVIMKVMKQDMHPQGRSEEPEDDGGDDSKR